MSADLFKQDIIKRILKCNIEQTEEMRKLRADCNYLFMMICKEDELFAQCSECGCFDGYTDEHFCSYINCVGRRINLSNAAHSFCDKCAPGMLTRVSFQESIKKEFEKDRNGLFCKYCVDHYKLNPLNE